MNLKASQAHCDKNNRIAFDTNESLSASRAPSPHLLREENKDGAYLEGFTFIEILVVLLIIGISFGFAVLAFGDFGEGRRIVFAAEQLVNTLELAKQQAILDTTTLSLHIDNNGYQILKIDPSATWDTKPYKGVFKMTLFPKNTLINLSTKSKKGHIVITPSGDMTDFSLQMGTNKMPDLVTVIGKHNGNLVLNSRVTK